MRDLRWCLMQECANAYEREKADAITRRTGGRAFAYADGFKDVGVRVESGAAPPLTSRPMRTQRLQRLHRT